MRARVYFADSDRWFRLKWFLKPGFSHCFIAMTVGDQEVLINPSSHYTYIGESEGVYEGEYLDVEVDEPIREPRTIWEVNTCVTIVKGFLGIRRYTIFTPYQLYRYLDGLTFQETEGQGTEGNSSRESTEPPTG